MAKSSSISSSFQPLAMLSTAAATSPRPRRPIGAPSSAAFSRAETTLQSFNRSPPRRGSQRGRGLMPMTTLRPVAASAPPIVPPPGGGPVPPVLPESEVPGLSQFLDTLKFDSSGMLVAIVQVRGVFFFVVFWFFLDRRLRRRRRQGERPRRQRDDQPLLLLSLLRCLR